MDDIEVDAGTDADDEDEDERGGRPAARPGWARWAIRIGAGLVALVLLVGFVFLAATRNPTVPPFYDPPAEVSAAPGTVLRVEPFDQGLPPASRGWRVLYASTDREGRPIAVSGLVIAPADPPEGPRPVLAWAHGTTGIDRPCAPSLADEPLEGIPDMTEALAEGWVVTLTDYPGLGTPSPHPYLVGESEGRAVLDSVRVAHALDLGLELDDRYAIWGHSQGGHAALFAGELAPSYLPDLPLVGVAALAPGTDLPQDFEAIQGTEAGTILTVLTVESWTDVYPDIPDDTLTEAVKPAAERLARNCINQPSRLRLLLGGLALPSDAVAIDPTSDPTWARYLADNTPDPGAIAGPVFVGQGLADEIISAPVTQRWVAERCDRGAPTTWVAYDGLTHNGVVAPGGADAFAWTRARFADAALPPNACPAP